MERPPCGRSGARFSKNSRDLVKLRALAQRLRIFNVSNALPAITKAA